MQRVVALESTVARLQREVAQTWDAIGERHDIDARQCAVTRCHTAAHHASEFCSFHKPRLMT